MNDGKRPYQQREAERRVIRLAETQFGVISRIQAIALGMSPRAIDRRVANGTWVRLCSGIYRLVGAVPTWEQQLIAACLWGGDGAIVSHRAAAALLRLDAVDRGLCEISTPSSRRSPWSYLVLHRSDEWLPADRHRIGPLPVTEASRTLIDLGAVCGAEVVEAALDCALRRRLTSVRRLEWRLDRMQGRGRKGLGCLRALLEERRYQKPTESPLEVRLGRLIAASDLPTPQRQFEIYDRTELLGRADFAYPAERLAIEAVSYEYHSGRQHWEKDVARLSRITTIDWRLMLVTKRQMDAPDAVIARIRKALGLLPP